MSVFVLEPPPRKLLSKRPLNTDPINEVFLSRTLCYGWACGLYYCKLMALVIGGMWKLLTGEL